MGTKYVNIFIQVHVIIAHKQDCDDIDKIILHCTYSI